jgi:hypothetical protein
MDGFLIPALNRDSISLSASWQDDRLTAEFLDAVHRADRDRQATRVTSDGRVLAVIVPARDGPDLLVATGRGGTLPEMREHALGKARVLYGQDAGLAVEHVSRVITIGRAFMADFTIRCTDFPREAL